MEVSSSATRQHGVVVARHGSVLHGVLGLVDFHQLHREPRRPHKQPGLATQIDSDTFSVGHDPTKTVDQSSRGCLSSIDETPVKCSRLEPRVPRIPQVCSGPTALATSASNVARSNMSLVTLPSPCTLTARSQSATNSLRSKYRNISSICEP